MLNNNEFSERIKKVMDYYGLSASNFAEKIEVPRSSISHILSGRNKPSLEFVLKINREFQEVDLYWLLNNEGSFPKTNSPTPKTDYNLFLAPNKTNNETNIETPTTENNTHEKPLRNSSIKKVLVFYHDGTFEEYNTRTNQ